MPAAETQQSYRVLWAQVVLQAKADLEYEPIGSILFDQAVAFFVSRGEWAESRRMVADCLDMHPDDLSNRGARWIADRRQREGLAPEEPKPALQSATLPPLPRLVAVAAADTGRRKSHPGAMSAVTPFNPFRHIAAFG